MDSSTCPLWATIFAWQKSEIIFRAKGDSQNEENSHCTKAKLVKCLKPWIYKQFVSSLRTSLPCLKMYSINVKTPHSCIHSLLVSNSLLEAGNTSREHVRWGNIFRIQLPVSLEFTLEARSGYNSWCSCIIPYVKIFQILQLGEILNSIFVLYPRSRNFSHNRNIQYTYGYFVQC